MANETIQKVITHAVNDEPAQVQTTVYDILHAKVNEYLDARTKWVGKHMFKKATEQGE